VIEILKPSNKVDGDGLKVYLNHQETLNSGGVSLVEIDLVRTGDWVLSAPLNRIADGYRTPYAVCVRRGWDPTVFEYFSIPLCEALPAIAIPLRQTDHHIPLDLQAVLNACCEEGRYIDDIDYRQKPDPPLGPEDARWADALLK
jgi:hypothetical protein